MNIQYVPLLQVQRELYRLPRGANRFRQYLRVMQNEDGDDLRLPPLVHMNPMGKDHLPALLDILLALNADGLATRALDQAAARTADVPGDFTAALVVADDAQGGWTNRYANEFTLRFGAEAHCNRNWITAVLWSSEVPSERSVREAILTAVYRKAYVLRHGPVRTLRDMLSQEGYVLAMADCTFPGFDEDDIEYTREVLDPFLDAEDMRTAIECLFGDEAGRSLGFTPRGLSKWAGLALALRDARHSQSLVPLGESRS